MDLNALHSLMNQKGFNYFTGLSNNEGLGFDFSTIYNGRGETVSIYITNENNSIEYFSNDGEAPLKKENINDNELFLFIRDVVK